MDYMTPQKQASEKWGVSVPTINYYTAPMDAHPRCCQNAGAWLIPMEAESKKGQTV